MFALGIRYLNGWAMASGAIEAGEWPPPEWPPHPDRVFMALAAAFFERGESADERRALEWIEQLPPPSLAASSATRRDPVVAYVPVNSTRPPSRSKTFSEKVATMAGLGDAKRLGLAALPEYRPRQPLTRPVAIPDSPDVFLIWAPAECPAGHLDALRRLCREVAYVGEPSSLVQLWVADCPPPATLEPDPSGVRATISLRVPSRAGEPGRLQRLQRHHELEAGQKQRLRIPSEQVRYRPAGPPPAAEPPRGSIFEDRLLIMRRTKGARLGLASAPQLIEALRGALFTACPAQPPPAWISGHDVDSAPTREPHIAILPLADVGHAHAAGDILGLALAIPRGAEPAQEKLLGAILLDAATATPRELGLNTRIGCCAVELADDDPRRALQSGTWTDAEGSPPGSRLWGTVTPIVFDRHPKAKWGPSDPPRRRAELEAAYWAEVENIIADGCARIGLPLPESVHAQPTSAWSGAPASHRFPRLLRKGGSSQRHTHAVLRFAEPVVGPIAIGAGRFVGYGFCRPIAESPKT